MAAISKAPFLACCALLSPGLLLAQTAAEAIRSSIDALEQAEHPDAGLLIDAQMSLGHAHAEEGDYARAIEAFEDAGELSRRHDGLFNETLIDIVYMMQRIARAGSDYQSAQDFQREAQRISWRALQESVRSIAETEGEDSPLHLEAMLGMADWLSDQRGVSPDTGRSWILEARAVYSDALELIDDEFDRDLALRVRVLRIMAADVGQHTVTSTYTGGSAYSSQQSFSAPGPSFTVLSEPAELVRARRIIKLNDQRDPVLLAAVYRDIGDWRLAAGRTNKAMEAYRDAWEILDATDNSDELRLLLFEEPQLLEDVDDRRNVRSWSNDYVRVMRRPPVSSAYSLLSSVLSDASFAEPGQVELEFVVDETGQAQDIQVISANPAWSASAAVALIQSRLFRPSFDQNKFLAAPGRYTWSFSYDPDLAAARGLINSPEPD